MGRNNTFASSNPSKFQTFTLQGSKKRKLIPSNVKIEPILIYFPFYKLISTDLRNIKLNPHFLALTLSSQTNIKKPDLANTALEISDLFRFLSVLTKGQNYALKELRLTNSTSREINCKFIFKSYSHIKRLYVGNKRTSSNDVALIVKLFAQMWNL